MFLSNLQLLILHFFQRGANEVVHFGAQPPPCAFRGGQREALAVARREAPAVARREALAVVQREAPAAVRREAPVVTSDYYTSIPLLDKHAMTRQAFGY